MLPDVLFTELGQVDLHQPALFLLGGHTLFEVGMYGPGQRWMPSFWLGHDLDLMMSSFPDVPQTFLLFFLCHWERVSFSLRPFYQAGS